MAVLILNEKCLILTNKKHSTVVKNTAGSYLGTVAPSAADGASLNSRQSVELHQTGTFPTLYRLSYTAAAKTDMLVTDSSTRGIKNNTKLR